VAGGWRTLHNEELHNLYVSLNISVIKSSGLRCAGHVACMGEMRNAYKILAGNPEGKAPLGGPRCKRKGNIRMDLTEIVWEGVE